MLADDEDEEDDVALLANVDDRGRAVDVVKRPTAGRRAVQDIFVNTECDDDLDAICLEGRSRILLNRSFSCFNYRAPQGPQAKIPGRGT